ncbi:MAG: hypothetical protein HYY29_04795 [Chloroflexi bacterium]|nr:hypothetical protein [Chloroflexota bacterium]
MRTRKSSRASEAEHVLAIAAYRNEQDRLRYLLQKALRGYGKPRTSLEEARALVSAQMGDRSLSQEIVQMREEGY